MTDEAHTAEEITATLLEAVRKSVGQYLGQPDPMDRERAREFLYETFFDSFPASTSYASLDVMQREMAVKAAVDLFEPFIHGMPEGYDPRKILGHPSEVALRMLEERFQDVLNQPLFLPIRYERLRRDNQIHDWGFKRIDETNGQLWFIPLMPTEFIMLSVGEIDLEGDDV